MTTTTKQIPDAALDQHIGMFGTTGSGKSYSARHLVERLLRSKAARSSPIVIIDPKGDWWGIRLAADGKTPAYPFIIVGGPHADQGLQIPEENPEAFAESLGAMIVKSSDRLIVDLSELGPEAMRRFVHAFAKVVYHDCRSALTIVMDEADEFAPMSGATGQATHCLSAVARIAKRGRGRGIRLWIISQRPASIHTDVRGQMGAVGCMKLTLPHDIKAVQEWMQSKDPEKAREIAKTFPTLRGGKQARAMGKGAEGWFWSPDHGDPQRVEWPAIETYDSMRTPEHGEERSGIEPTPIDTATLVRALDAAVKDAEANDPKKLRDRVHELEAQLSDALNSHTPSAEDPAVQRLQRELEELRSDYGHAMTDLEADRNHVAELRERIRHLVRTMEHHAQQVQGVADDIRRAATDFARQAVDTPVPAPEIVRPVESCPTPTLQTANGVHVRRASGTGAMREAEARKPMDAPTGGGNRPAAAGGLKLDGTQRRLLDACAAIHATTRLWPSRNQLGWWAGVKPTGGHFNNSIGPLVTSGLLQRTSDGYQLSEAGRAAATQGAITARAARDRILGMLDGTQQRILKVLIAHRGKWMDRASIGAQCDPPLKSDGGHFNNSIGPLVTGGLLERQTGHYRLADWMARIGM